MQPSQQAFWQTLDDLRINSRTKWKKGIQELVSNRWRKSSEAKLCFEITDKSWSSWFQFLVFDTRLWEVRQIDRFLWGQIRELGSQGVYTWRLIRWHNPNLADMEKYSISPFFFICKKKKLARSLEIIVLYECDLFQSQFTIMKDILPTW